jgi:hypothetical protein
MKKSEKTKASQRRMNPQTVAALKENGADVSKIHKIINVFYANTEDSAAMLVKTLEDEGFELIDPGGRLMYQGREHWAVHAALDMVPAINRLNSMTDRCVDVAGPYQCEYDGWYTEPVS